EYVGEVCLRIDAVQFASFNERSDTGPIFGAVIVASEECIFSIQNNRTDASLDNVGVELDAAVIKEASEPVPVVQGIADVFGDRRLARDTCELLFEPDVRGRRGDDRSAAPRDRPS